MKHIYFYRLNDERTFTFALEDAEQCDDLGKTLVRYELRDYEHIYFQGEDFAASPLHAPTDAVTASSLLKLLTWEFDSLVENLPTEQEFNEAQQAFLREYWPQMEVWPEDLESSEREPMKRIYVAACDSAAGAQFLWSPDREELEQRMRTWREIDAATGEDCRYAWFTTEVPRKRNRETATTLLDRYLWDCPHVYKGVANATN